jgi:hypothetical protein
VPGNSGPAVLSRQCDGGERQGRANRSLSSTSRPLYSLTSRWDTMGVRGKGAQSRQRDAVLVVGGTSARGAGEREALLTCVWCIRVVQANGRMKPRTRRPTGEELFRL